jgi:hypothetical protein
MGVAQQQPRFAREKLSFSRGAGDQSTWLHGFTWFPYPLRS